MPNLITKEMKVGGGGTIVEVHEGAARVTVQDVIDYITERGLDPTGVYISPQLMCYGESTDHDKHIELFWTLSNRHPCNRYSTP